MFWLISNALAVDVPAPAIEPATAPTEVPATEGENAAEDLPVEEAPVEPPPEPTLEELWPVLFPGQCTPSDPHFDLELVYYEGQFDNGLQECDSRLSQGPDKDLYWMKARFLFEVGERFQRTDTSIDKEGHYQKMLDTTNEGLALAPGDLHLRFIRGVAMGRLGTTRGVLSSLFMAKDVEQDWLAVAQSSSFSYASLGAREQLPCDAYHALGIFYRLVPDWWIVQVLAGTRGSLPKSVEWHTKATQCKPTAIQNWKELGATQLCLGTNEGDPAIIEAGVASLRKAKTLPPDTERAAIDVKHSQMLIDKPELACEYSRDGQQDLDEDKLPQ